MVKANVDQALDVFFGILTLSILLNRQHAMVNIQLNIVTL